MRPFAGAAARAVVCLAGAFAPAFGPAFRRDGRVTAARLLGRADLAGGAAVFARGAVVDGLVVARFAAVRAVSLSATGAWARAWDTAAFDFALLLGSAARAGAATFAAVRFSLGLPPRGASAAFVPVVSARGTRFRAATTCFAFVALASGVGSARVCATFRPVETDG